MSDFDPLSHSAKNHRVIANNIPCTNGLNSNFARLPLSNLSLSRIHTDAV
jgi:hypothetical protein